MTTIHTPFSKPVMVHEMEDHEEFKKIIVPEIIKKYEARSYTDVDWGKYCKTWSTKAMGLHLIEDQLTGVINSWLSFFRYPFVRYKLEAWYNVHTYDMYQEVHRHMSNRNLLCGIYYIQLSEKDRPVAFIDLDNRYMESTESIDMAPAHEMMSQDFEPDLREGEMILFRPDAYHLAPPAIDKHDGYRISLAFNVIV